MQRRDQKKEPDHIGPGLGKRLAAYEDLNQAAGLSVSDATTHNQPSVRARYGHGTGTTFLSVGLGGPSGTVRY